MSVQFDAATTEILVDPATTATFSHTCSGSNRALLVLIASSGASDHVSGVTYNGVALTRAAAETAGAAAATYAYVLADPATGANNVVVTASSAFANLAIYAVSFTGVDTADLPTSSIDVGNGFQTSPMSSNVTVPAGGMAVDIINGTLAAGTFTPIGSQTQIGSQLRPGGDTALLSAASYLADATAMAWSWSTGTRQATHTTLVLSPSAGGATDTPINPGVGTLTITGYAPAVAQTTDAVDTSLTPGVGSIAITGYAPSIAQTTLGTIVTPVLKNNTGTVLASETGVVVNVYHSTTGALVLQKTGLTSSALGVVTVTDDALEPGTTYAYEVVLSGNGRRLPIAEAA